MVPINAINFVEQKIFRCIGWWKSFPCRISFVFHSPFRQSEAIIGLREKHTLLRPSVVISWLLSLICTTFILICGFTLCMCGFTLCIMTFSHGWWQEPSLASKTWSSWDLIWTASWFHESRFYECTFLTVSKRSILMECTTCREIGGLSGL